MKSAQLTEQTGGRSARLANTSRGFLDFLQPIEHFRAILDRDAGLQDRLAAIEEREDWRSAIMDMAATCGIALDTAQVDLALRPDPLGLDRFDATPIAHGAWPARHWLPTAIVSTTKGPAIDWTHFGRTRLSEPFFEESVRRASRQSP